MSYATSSAHSVQQLVERACRRWEAGREAAARRDLGSPPAPAFTIALEREAGTQGTSIAHAVGKLLDWQVYDHELLERIAKDMGLQTTLLQSVDEREQSWLLETAEAFLSAPNQGDWGPLVSELGYVHHLIKTVLALGLHGECVIVGRGAAFILPPATTLRVRLAGAVRERIAAHSQKLGISENEAARQIRTLDRERTDFVQDHFLKNPADPQNYDLVVNVPRFSEMQCAELIVEALQRIQAHRPAKIAVAR